MLGYGPETSGQEFSEVTSQVENAPGIDTPMIPSSSSAPLFVQDPRNPNLDFIDYYDIAYPDGTFQDYHANLSQHRTGAQKRQASQAERMLKSSKNK